jgi:hypothetical protein
MALRDIFESPLQGEIHSPELNFPFSPDVTTNLRAHILIASGAFSRMDIVDQLKSETEFSIISQFVTTKITKSKPINIEMVVASLERPQMEIATGINPGAAIGLSFSEFLNGIIDLGDKVEEIRRKKDDGAKKMSTEIQSIFKSDDILRSLEKKLRSMVGASEDDKRPYKRAILAQKAVLIGINLQKLTY